MSTARRLVTLPKAPRNASPVPWLTSIHSTVKRGPWGSAAYPGNCDGYLIKDLLQYFKPRRVLDPMTGSGTCRDVCRDLRIACDSFDLASGRDAADPASYRSIEPSDFCWLHPPYWRQKLYTRDPRDLSRTRTLDAFLERYRQLIANCATALAPGGRLAILMGDYSDRDAGSCRSSTTRNALPSTPAFASVAPTSSASATGRAAAGRSTDRRSSQGCTTCAWCFRREKQRDQDR